MSKLILSDFSGGLSSQLDKNLPSEKFYIGDGVDIYSSPGYIQPGIASSVITKSSASGDNSGLLDLYWTFDENTGTSAYDNSGNENTGTIVSAPPFVAGKLGYALDLDGSADYVSTTTPTFIDDTEGSVSFWVKLDANNVSYWLWAASVDGANDDEFYLEYNGSTNQSMSIYLTVNGATTLNLTTPASIITDTTNWHHVVITSNGSTLKFYIDNVEKTLTETIGTNTGQWFASATQADIFCVGGMKRVAIGAPTNGKIDEVRVYTTALTAAEISELYTNPMVSAIFSNIKDIYVDSLNSTVYLHTGTKISRISNIDNGTFNPVFDTTGGINHTIATAEALISVGHENLLIYPCNISSTSTPLLFYTWGEETGADTGDAGTYNIAGATFDDDWLSTVPTNAAKLNYARHPLLEWNAMLWIGNGKSLAKLDGTTGANGTLNLTALNLPEGWEIIKLFPTANYIGIIAWYKGTLGTNTLCRAYFWDGTSTAYSFFIPIQENAVYDVINKNGEILFVGAGREEQGVLYRLISGGIGGGGTSKIMALKHYINGTEIKGSGTYPNALAIHNNLLLIGNSQYGAVIYAYGQKEEGSPLSFSMPYRLSTGVTQGYQIRCIKPINATNIFVGWTDGTIFYLSRILLTSTTKTGANYKAGYTDFGQKVRINYVKFYFKPLASGDSITPTLDADYGTSWTLTDNAGATTIAYATDGAITSKRFNIKRDCHAIRPAISFTTGNVNISKICIDYNFIEDN